MSKPSEEFRRFAKPIVKAKEQHDKLTRQCASAITQSAIRMVKQSGMSQRQIALAMGISAPYLGDLLAGNRAWNMDVISKFEKALAK